MGTTVFFWRDTEEYSLNCLPRQQLRGSCSALCLAVVQPADITQLLYERAHTWNSGQRKHWRNHRLRRWTAQISGQTALTSTKDARSHRQNSPPKGKEFCNKPAFDSLALSSPCAAVRQPLVSSKISASSPAFCTRVKCERQRKAQINNTNLVLNSPWRGHHMHHSGL